MEKVKQLRPRPVEYDNHKEAFYKVVEREIDVEGLGVQTDVKALVREDNSKRVGITSSYYKVIQNEEIYRFVEDAFNSMDMTPVYEKVIIFQEGARIIQKLSFNTEIIEPIPGEPIQLKIFFQNGFDTRSSISFFFSAERLSTKSGITVFSPEFRVSVKHIGKPDKFKSNFLSKLDKFVSQLKNDFMSMYDFKFKSIQEVYEFISNCKAVSDRTKKAVVTMFNENRSLVGWDVYLCFIESISALNTNEFYKYNLIRNTHGHFKKFIK